MFDPHSLPFERDDIDKALNTLMDKGVVEMSWSEEHNDFVFSLTGLGRDLADHISDETDLGLE